jgi:uncharacterized phage infection (PIP) family protein YhgE
VGRDAGRQSGSSSVGVRSLLRHWFAWSLVGLGGVLALIMSFSYLHAFLEPTNRLEGLPIGIVNLDRGADALGQHLDAGKEVLAEATAPQPGDQQPVKWVEYRSRAEMVRDIRNFDLYGGFVIPADFSEEIVALGTALGVAPPAHLEVLASSGTGQFGTAVFERVTGTLVPGASANVRKQVVEQLQAANAQVPPAGVKTLGTPVVARTVDLVPISDVSGRGLAPFYFALMMTLAGFATTTAVSIGIDVLAGHEEFDVLGRIIRLPDRGASESARWGAKAVIIVVMAPLAALAETVMAVNILGMQTSSWWNLFLFAWLGITAVAALSLVFLVALGIIGELVAVIFITIFGVPSALGVYPQYALPPLFRFISDWHPMRFETDGARSIVFFGSRTASGLGAAIPVLLAYLVGSLVAGWALAKLVDHWTARHRRRLVARETVG